MTDTEKKVNKSAQKSVSEDSTEPGGLNTDITVISVKGLRSDSLEAGVGVFHIGRRFQSKGRTWTKACKSIIKWCGWEKFKSCGVCNRKRNMKM